MKHLKEIIVTKELGTNSISLLLEENPLAVRKHIPVQRHGTKLVVPALDASDVDELMEALAPHSNFALFYMDTEV